MVFIYLCGVEDFDVNLSDTGQSDCSVKSVAKNRQFGFGSILGCHKTNADDGVDGIV